MLIFLWLARSGARPDGSVDHSVSALGSITATVALLGSLETSVELLGSLTITATSGVQ